MLTVHGVTPSPFVRKVLLCLEHKSLDYTLVPVMPGANDDAFRELSPLGKIPVLQHDELTLCDSSIICRYLDQVFPGAGLPEVALYPKDPAIQAKAAWLEEYADTVLVGACAGLFQQRLLNPKLLGKACDESMVTDILQNQLPPLLDYVESQVGDTEYLFGEQLSIADIAIVTCFAQAAYGEFQVDEKTHPKLAAYLAVRLADPILLKLLEAEKAMFGG